jgi:hypothetical protein
MSELLIALVGALVGCGVTWLLGAADRAQARKALDAQQRLLDAQQKLLDAQQAATNAQVKIATLEAERDEREFFGQFSPRVQFQFEYPKGNTMLLDADEPFIVESIDYLTISGASVGSQDVGQSSKSVRIPISNEFLGSARALGPERNDRSAALQFRINMQKDGMRKPHLVPAVVRLEMLQTPQAWVQVMKVMG